MALGEIARYVGLQLPTELLAFVHGNARLNGNDASENQSLALFARIHLSATEIDSGGKPVA